MQSLDTVQVVARMVAKAEGTEVLLEITLAQSDLAQEPQQSLHTSGR
jgi:hypothetical protein